MNIEDKSKLVTKPIKVMGMDLTAFKYKGVFGQLGEEKDWATIYHIESTNPNKGECQECLRLLKEKYKDKMFGCSIALNPKMQHILKKLKIKEYKED